jgi:hypothetical protein
VPTSGKSSIGLNETVFIMERMYFNPHTKVGPDGREVISAVVLHYNPVFGDDVRAGDVLWVIVTVMVATLALVGVWAMIGCGCFVCCRRKVYQPLFPPCHSRCCLLPCLLPCLCKTTADTEGRCCSSEASRQAYHSKRGGMDRDMDEEVETPKPHPAAGSAGADENVIDMTSNAAHGGRGQV